MNRFAAVLIVLSLGFVACAHDHALGRNDVAAMENDSPAISPWLGSAPNEMGEDPQGPADEE
jgi:hypothetical protein